VAPRRYAATSSSMRAGAEPVLDLPHGGVVGRAQPRTSSIAQLSERLRARQKVRVEVPKLQHCDVARHTHGDHDTPEL
jgi:hypothetical protein